MWTQYALYLALGLVFGSLVGSINHWLVWSALKKSQGLPPEKGRNKVMSRYLIRYVLDFSAMAAYLLHRDTLILVGTAIGLTLIGKILAIKYSLREKGVK